MSVEVFLPLQLFETVLGWALALLPDISVGKESAFNVGDLDSILRLGRSPGAGKGYPLQYIGLVIHGQSLGSQRVGCD